MVALSCWVNFDASSIVQVPLMDSYSSGPRCDSGCPCTIPLGLPKWVMRGEFGCSRHAAGGSQFGLVLILHPDYVDTLSYGYIFMWDIIVESFKNPYTVVWERSWNYNSGLFSTPKQLWGCVSVSLPGSMSSWLQH